MDEAHLQLLAARNPVACAISFEHLIENIRDNLLCASSSRKKNVLLSDRSKGIFGIALSNRDVKETNKRGSFHVHGQHHGGALPSLVADVASDPELRSELLQGLDDQLCAELPLVYHAMERARHVLRVGARRDAAFDVPLPPEDLRVPPVANASSAAWAEHRRRLQEEWWPNFFHHAMMVVANRHVHVHCGTCLQGKRGKTGCRMAASWGHDVEQTRCVQLRPFGTSRTADDVDADVLPHEHLLSEAPNGFEHRCGFCHADGALCDTTLDAATRKRLLADEAGRRDLFYRCDTAFHCTCHTFALNSLYTFVDCLVHHACFQV